MLFSKLFDRNMDYSLVTAVIFLMILGVVMIHSASSGVHIETEDYWIKQLLWSVISIFVMFSVALTPHKFFYAFAYVFYAIGIILLLITYMYGTMGGGAERWLSFGSVRLQPSEFMKVATILTLARFLSFKHNKPRTYLRCIVPFIIAGFPMVLILKQPDLGTALVFAAIILPMLYWAGLDTTRLFFLISPVLSAILTAPFLPFYSRISWVIFMLVIVGVLYLSRFSLFGMTTVLVTNILAGIATPLIFNKLKPYQQKRITAVINPEADPRGAGWQIINSKIAIGSGGIFGKGIGKGRYTELGFLPRSHTDFIFSVVGEELGLIGALSVLAVMFYIVARAVQLAGKLKNPFSSIAAGGIGIVFAFHMFVNVGMVIGIMPVTGLPLPFLSYGGSACLSNALMIGLLLNFSLNRHEY